MGTLIGYFRCSTAYSVQILKYDTYAQQYWPDIVLLVRHRLGVIRQRTR